MRKNIANTGGRVLLRTKGRAHFKKLARRRWIMAMDRPTVIDELRRFVPPGQPWTRIMSIRTDYLQRLLIEYQIGKS